MITCHICLEELKFPVSLPCGHIFCKECIRRAVDAIKSYSSLHSCPTCRALYTVAPIDPAVVPAHLRPHLTPSIRKVFLDQLLRDGPRPSAYAASGSADVEIARLRAENAALRTNCDMWRRRAEVHGAATLGLLELTRLARDQAIHVSRERDELQKRCISLKRRLDEDESIMRDFTLPSPFTSGLSEIVFGKSKRPLTIPDVPQLEDEEPHPRKRVKLEEVAPDLSASPRPRAAECVQPPSPATRCPCPADKADKGGTSKPVAVAVA